MITKLSKEHYTFSINGEEGSFKGNKLLFQEKEITFPNLVNLRLFVNTLTDIVEDIDNK